MYVLTSDATCRAPQCGHCSDTSGPGHSLVSSKSSKSLRDLAMSPAWRTHRPPTAIIGESMPLAGSSVGTGCKQTTWPPAQSISLSRVTFYVCGCRVATEAQCSTPGAKRRDIPMLRMPSVSSPPHNISSGLQITSPTKLSTLMVPLPHRSQLTSHRASSRVSLLGVGSIYSLGDSTIARAGARDAKISLLPLR